MPDQFSVVGADDDRRTLSVYFFEEGHDFKGELGVEIAGRLISEENLGIVDHRPGNGYPLLFSIGQLKGILPHFMMKVDHSQSIKNSPPDFFARNSQHLEDNCHVIEHSLMEGKAEVLENNAHDPPQFIDFMFRNTENVPLVDNDLALGR